MKIIKKYKNKDGLELNLKYKNEESKLIKEVITEAINMCDKYNLLNKPSIIFALRNVKEFLQINFNLEEDE